MKCYHHPDRDAVAYCGNCGRGLCSECSDRYDPVLCEKCAQEIISDQRAEDAVNLKKAKRTLKTLRIIMIVFAVLGVLGGILTLTSGSGKISDVLSMVLGVPLSIWFILGIPSGWRALNKAFDKLKFILIMPIIGWLIFYTLKLYLASFVGIVAFPIEYFKLRKLVKSAERS